MNDVSNKHRKSAFAVIFLFFILSLPVLLFSQNWEFVWALPSGGTDIDKAYDITVDSLSNVIITGQFFGTATFDTAILLSSGDSDIFIAKYDRGGNLLWAKKAGGTAEDFSSAIDTDRDGNIIITGYFNGNIDFDTISLSSDGGTDIFIAKYSPSGDIIWAKRAGGTGNDSGESLACDNSDNIIVTGRFEGTANFGTIFLDNFWEQDIFVVKYNSSGDASWARLVSGSYEEIIKDIAVDNFGNSIITGTFDTSINFNSDPISTPITLVSSGGNDIFIARYDSWGNIIWARQAGGKKDEVVTGIAIDFAGNFFITGYFEGNLSFGGQSIKSNGNLDVFIAKYTFFGMALWATNGGGKNDDVAEEIATTPAGNCVITGYFQGDATFGPKSLTSAGQNDIFIARCDASGNMLGAKPAGGPGQDIGLGIIADYLGNCIATGFFDSDTANFSNKTLINSSINPDIFCAKNSLEDPSLPVELSSFYAEVENKNIVLFWQTQSEIDNSGFNIYRSFEADGLFKRINPLIIEGLGNSPYGKIYSFTDTGIGSGITYYYKLENVNFDGGRTMHGPIKVEPNISSDSNPKEFVLAQNYPNPFSSFTTIKFTIPNPEFVTIKIYDLNGKLVKKFENRGYKTGTHSITWDATNFNGTKVSKGLYLYSIRAGNFNETYKLILQ